MSGRGILNVVKVLNDAIKHMGKDFIPIDGDFHASTSIRESEYSRTHTRF
jgi:hypothetical protein